MADKKVFFTDEEVTVLVDLYVKNKDALLGKFGSAAGAQSKKRLWKEILEAVNAVGNNNRTLDQLKKKVKNMKQATKSVAVSNKKSFTKTGGGTDDDESLDSNQDKLLSTISQRQITGIPGGMDIHERKVKLEMKLEKKPRGGLAGSGTDLSGTDQRPLATNQGVQSSEPLNQIVLLNNIQNVPVGKEIEIVVTNSDQEDDANNEAASTRPSVTSNTPTTPTSRGYGMGKKRRSTFDDGPQVKIMKQQVSAVEDQVCTFNRIEKILEELRDIEKQKLKVMEAHLTLKWMKLSQNKKNADDIQLD